MSIYIGTIAYEVNQEDLTYVFTESYDTVKPVHVPTDRDTGFVKGFACVGISMEAEEEQANKI